MALCEIHQTQRAELMPVDYQRRARVKSDVGLASDERVRPEARVRLRVLHQQHLAGGSVRISAHRHRSMTYPPG